MSERTRRNMLRIERNLQVAALFMVLTIVVQVLRLVLARTTIRSHEVLILVCLGVVAFAGTAAAQIHYRRNLRRREAA